MQERDFPEMGAAKDFTIRECSFFIQMSFCYRGHAARHLNLPAATDPMSFSTRVKEFVCIL
jgi:hypothetical protein